MVEFKKVPGGYRITDPGVGWHNEPSCGMDMKDPGTGI